MNPGLGAVLVVDDDADIRDAVTMLLEDAGYPTRQARDGVDALEQLDELPLPALILLDVMMPRMNGAEFLHALKITESLAAIPVVVLSGDTHAVSEARALGASGSIPKPPNANQILDAVGRFVR